MTVVLEGRERLREWANASNTQDLWERVAAHEVIAELEAAEATVERLGRVLNAVYEVLVVGPLDNGPLVAQIRAALGVSGPANADEKQSGEPRG